MKAGKIGLWLIVIAVIALGLIMAGLFTIAGDTFQFAGFTFTDDGETQSATINNCGYGSSQSDIYRSGEFLVLTSQANNAPIARSAKADITGIDEILVIYDGSGNAYCAQGQGGWFTVSATIIGSASGSISNSVSVSGSDGGSCAYGDGASASRTFPPSLWKFKNNFDGTWSTLTSLGVGDVFVVKNTYKVTGDKTYLSLAVSSGSSCQGNSVSAGGRGTFRIYNIIIKENSVALCKADQVPYDLNGDGKIMLGECTDLKTIILNSEEAIKESYEAKFARLQSELEAKNKGLQIDIAALQQQLAAQQGYNDAAIRQQLTSLQSELDSTKKMLADVQAKDPTIINLIQKQEAAKPINPISEFFNRILAWFKNLFG